MTMEMHDNYHFIPYNTGMKQLKLPEYGRGIQDMVDYCVGIPDRDERNYCAEAIVAAMARLVPANVGENGDMKKLWDHLNIMSEFRLEVDFPVDVVTEETLNPKPEKIPYAASRIGRRHYGKNIEQMVRRVADMEEGPEKEALISMVAHHMKMLMMLYNRQGVSDAVVLADLAEFSGGRIVLDPERYILHEFMEVQRPVPNRKKKNRKNKY